MALLDPTVRRRRFAFMLTPLVDVMFLLLIFFMFTTQTAPYSLLAITAPAAPSGAPASPAATPSQGAAPPAVLISIEHGFVSYDGRRIPLTGLAAAIAASKAAGLSRAVVLTSGTATVQDVVSVVEAFDATDFGDVQLVMQGSGPS